MDVRFRTLTPLWTGGVDGISGRARETGLIGSLRWWYEGIVRGMGGYACDPAGDHSCAWDAQDPRPVVKQLCAACYMFGCTGWRRRFRLDARGLEPQELFFVASSGVYQASSRWLWQIFGGDKAGGERHGGGGALTFSFGDVRTLWGQQAVLRIVPLGGDHVGTLARASFLVDILSRWGALGAKPQHGFGQIALLDRLERADAGRALIADDIRRCREEASNAAVFNLHGFFAHIYQIAESQPYRGTGREIGTPPPGLGDYREHFIPCAFDIRYKSRSKHFRTGGGENFGMRPWFHEKWGKTVAHQLFGRSDARSDDQRSAGRIHVSHLYRRNGRWHLKVWGHVPGGLRDDGRRHIGVGDVAAQVTAFVAAMFPGSQLVEAFDPEKELGR